MASLSPEPSGRFERVRELGHVSGCRENDEEIQIAAAIQEIRANESRGSQERARERAPFAMQIGRLIGTGVDEGKDDEATV